MAASVRAPPAWRARPRAPLLLPGWTSSLELWPHARAVPFLPAGRPLPPRGRQPANQPASQPARRQVAAPLSARVWAPAAVAAAAAASLERPKKQPAGARNPNWKICSTLRVIITWPRISLTGLFMDCAIIKRAEFVRPPASATGATLAAWLAGRLVGWLAPLARPSSLLSVGANDLSTASKLNLLSAPPVAAY